MSSDELYITYANGSKVSIYEISEPLLIEEMMQIEEDSNLDEIKTILKERNDNLVSLLEEARGPVKDMHVWISDGPRHFKRIMGPVWEDVEDCKTKQKYIRYARSVEFTD